VAALEVAIRADGELRVPVAEDVLDDRQEHTRLEHHARGGVAQVVEADWPHLRDRPKQHLVRPAAPRRGIWLPLDSIRVGGADAPETPSPCFPLLDPATCVNALDTRAHRIAQGHGRPSHMQCFWRSHTLVRMPSVALLHGLLFGTAIFGGPKT
jgi:hypothetical protein